MTVLTKNFQLIWNAETKEIIKQGGNTTYTNHPCFEADTEVEIEAKIVEKKLTKIKAELSFP